jgi:hypothetical protein
VFKNRINSKEKFSVISVSENSKNSEPLVVIVQYILFMCISGSAMVFITFESIYLPAWMPAHLLASHTTYGLSFPSINNLFYFIFIPVTLVLVVLLLAAA